MNASIESEPTTEQLRIALRVARETGTYKDLKRISGKKTTWVGPDQVALMFEIDRYLRTKE